MSNYGRHHWSNAAYKAVFFKVNAMVAFPWVFLALSPSWSHLWFAIVMTVFFSYIELRKKISISAAFRYLRVGLVGRTKSTKNMIKEWINN